ncbi:hypothetical protein [Pseudomonas chlororaphis]|uniref:hypothetical protein n=1 Tax=Pseudomonas chlororaphis TaxID=587753 RepID=UPI000F58E6EE|nr:hypothetical protein [Pseudomonas chlororaphis]AZD07568.1 hypothetical protein C4K26_2165 [Pseudomonas chlororaphis]WDG52496.1 hypothetical protein PUP76_21860 [Pseudomonas chlororaphis]WDH86487.1 hypothetical protein PUP74_20325 [Pseudomonas chlororaphis]
MLVRIDGKLVEREHYVECLETSGPSGFGYGLPRQEPELFEGEEIAWMLGDAIPTIIRTFDPA